MVTYHHLWVGYYFLFQVEANWQIGQQLADQFLCMVDTCNRLGGTGLGFTEEVEDVGDLHRGELLAVLAVTGGGELLEKVGDALDPSHQVSTGYCWSSIGKIQES